MNVNLDPRQRRAFLRVSGITALGLTGLAALAACGTPTPPPPVYLHTAALQVSDRELSMLENDGVVSRMEGDFIDSIGYDERLSVEAQAMMFGFFTARGAQDVVKSTITKIKTPQFLIDRGISVADDLATVYGNRTSNGGLSIFDTKAKIHLKMAPRGSKYAQYLSESSSAWRTTWAAGGASAEELNKIQLLESVVYDGVEYTALVNPHVGATLEWNLSHGLLNQGQTAQLLEDYYLRVLAPANRVGVVQKDLNFRNIVVDEITGRLFPIDLDQARRLYDQSILPQWQYEELATRASRRGIILPAFDEFARNHAAQLPDVKPVIQALKTIDLKIDGTLVRVVIPYKAVEGLTGNDMFKTVERMKTSIIGAYRNAPQGDFIPVQIEGAGGTVHQLNIVKTSSFGQEMAYRGGKAAKILEAVKGVSKVGERALLSLWILDTFAQLIDDPFVAQLQSSVALPDTLARTQKTEISKVMDEVFNNLMRKKMDVLSELDRVGDRRYQEDRVKSFLGISRQDIALMTREYGISMHELKDMCGKSLQHSMSPLARINVSFADPFPGLIGSDNPETNGYISVARIDNTNVTYIWVKDNDQVELVATAYKDDGTQSWRLETMTDKNWNIKFDVLGTGKIILGCEMNKQALTEEGNFSFYCKSEK